MICICISVGYVVHFDSCNVWTQQGFMETIVRKLQQKGILKAKGFTAKYEGKLELLKE